MNNNYFHVNDFKVLNHLQNKVNKFITVYSVISNQLTIPYFYGYLLHLKFTNISYETCKKRRI